MRDLKRAAAFGLVLGGISFVLLGCGGGGSGTTTTTTKSHTATTTTTTTTTTKTTITLTTTTTTTSTTTTTTTTTTTAQPCKKGGDVDLRISKAMYTRGYNKMRLSVITQANETPCGVPKLQYSRPFQQRWTDKMLHTEVIDIPDGGRSITIGNETVNIGLPKEGSPVMGLITADPCWARGAMPPDDGDFGCNYGGTVSLTPGHPAYNILESFPLLIDDLVGSDDFHYWGIIGDNFYDQRGKVSKTFMDKVGSKAKTKPLFSVPGNHDFWIHGGPDNDYPWPGDRDKKARDQKAWGFMQFWGQDTYGATESSPFNFAGNASLEDRTAVLDPGMPKADNFMFVTQVGDVAFFGFSNAHPWSGVTQPRAEEFCNYVGKTKTVNTAIIFGHWNAQNAGCQADMSTDKVYTVMKTLPGCDKKVLLYFDGHQHCNWIDKPYQSGPGPDAVGFMIGGAGMAGTCDPMWGFAVVESVGTNVQVDYVSVGYKMTDRSKEMHACFSQKGYKGCRAQYATTWRTVPGSSKMEVYNV